MEKVTLFFASLFITVTLNAQIQPTDTDGDGYYNISTLDHLRWVSENDACWSWNFELDNDIDAGDTKNWNDGWGWSPISTFTDKFDGNGYGIDSLFISRISQDCIGLFGRISGITCGIKNLGLTNSIITGKGYVGGLVGWNNTGTLSNCYATGVVTGSIVTVGLVGDNYSSGTIENSFWEIETSGIDSSDGGTAKTTVEIKTKNTFTDADWDFETIWNIDPDINDGYPYLRKETVSVTENLLTTTTNLTCSPNPCTTASKIGYSVNNAGFVNIAVYDIFGNEVAVLVNNYQAAGEHEVVFNAEALSAGIYFITINAAGTMETGKIIVAR